MRISSQLLSYLIFSFICETSFAATINSNHWYFSIGGGASKISLPDNTTVPNGAAVPPPNNQDTYTITSPTTAIAQFDIGYRWYEAREYFPYYNVAFQYRHFFHTNIEGNVDQYSLPGFVNYDYELNYEADMFTINGKVDLVQWSQFMPYVAGGIGAILNHVNSYSETPTAGVTPRISPNFAGNSTTSLAATLGFGVDYIFNKDIWFTLGYDHVFQGDLKTGSGSASWSGTNLDIGNIKMDTVFLSVSMNLPETLMY